MNSMTGFGRANVERDGRKISLELKSVNHRYLDLNIRLQRALSQSENVVRQKIKDTLQRGHVDAYIYYKNLRDDAKIITVDKALAKTYAKALNKIRKATGAKNDITAVSLSKMSDVLIVSEGKDDQKAMNAILNEALDIALLELSEMRQKEGMTIKDDLLQNINTLDAMLQEIIQNAPQVKDVYKQKMMARVAEFLDGTNGTIDESRLLGEVAMYCDKSAIDEEISRLTAHIAAFKTKCEEDGALGRSLDFMVQELNREVNTVCSKANDIGITNTALTMKNTVEKIREQVQNAE